MDNLKLAFDETFQKVIIDSIPQGKHHFFSLKYKRRRNDLIYRKQITAEPLPKAPIRITGKIVIALIAAAVLTIAAGAIIYWNRLYIEQHDIFALLNITDYTGSPSSIMSSYAISADMSDYTADIITDEPYLYSVLYQSKTNTATISFEQKILSAVEGTRLNTENALIDITMVDIQNNPAIFYETKDEEQVFIWDNGDYVFTVAGYGIGYNELKSIAENVKKVE